MKIKPEQLTQSLTKSDRPSLVIISGDEPLITDELCNQTLGQIKKEGFDNITRLNTTTGFKWESFTQATQSLSLFAEKTGVLLSLTSWKLDTTAKEILTHFAQRQSQHHFVIVTGPKLETATQNTKWFKAIEKHSLFCPVWPIEGAKLPQWIHAKAKSFGLSLSEKQVHFIAEHTEGNLLAARQELEKLSLLNTPITDSILENCISYSAEHNSFKLIDHCLAGHIKQTSSILLSLQHQGIEPILILWAINKEIQLLNQLMVAQEKGVSLRSAAAKLRVWDKKLALYQKYLSQHNSDACLYHLRLIADIDKTIKGALAGDVWRALHHVCMSIAGLPLAKPTA